MYILCALPSTCVFVSIMGRPYSLCLGSARKGANDCWRLDWLSVPSCSICPSRLVLLRVCRPLISDLERTMRDMMRSDGLEGISFDFEGGDEDDDDLTASLADESQEKKRGKSSKSPTTPKSPSRNHEGTSTAGNRKEGGSCNLL